MPPLLMKFPPRVSALFPVARLAPLLIVSGTEVLKTFAAFIVIVPVLAITTPPLAASGSKRKHANANFGGRLGFLLAGP